MLHRSAYNLHCGDDSQAKGVVDLGQLSVAEIVIEKAAFYEERLRHVSTVGKGTMFNLSCGYLFLRIALAWRRGRLDIAKVMLGQVETTADLFSRTLAEQLADLLLEIANDLKKQKCFTEASYWLEKAYGAFIGQHTKAIADGASDIKIRTIHSFIRILIELEGDDNRSRAWELIHGLENEYAEKLALLFLKLDLLASESSPSLKQYSDVLHKIIDNVHLTETNIKAILHYTHRLRSWSPSMAHKVLTYFISGKLVGTEQVAWLEKTLVLTIWNCTSASDIPGSLDSLATLFDTITSISCHVVSPPVTHAAQILLWKCIEHSYYHGQYDVSWAWCKLSLHRIFNSSGSANFGKLQRKLMLCALRRGISINTSEICAQMPPSDLKEPLTQYLLYKIALRGEDLGEAMQCLVHICETATEDVAILYGCVVEAQKTGHQTQSIASLKQVLEKFKHGAPKGVHLPVLLRCTARLLIQEFGDEPTPSEDILEDICQVFEAAATQAQQSQCETKDSPFTRAELDWFSRNSYNLAVKNCNRWPPAATSRLVKTGVHLINLYPPGLDQNTLADLGLRRLFCNFLVGSLSIVRGRQADAEEIQLQHCLDVTKAVDAFRADFGAQMDRVGEGAKDDLRQKYLALLAYDYEAAIRLKAWGSLESIIEESQEYGNPDVFAILADITLAFKAPTDITITTLQQITNATWTQQREGVAKLSRWIRCLYCLSLSHGTDTAGQLLNQVLAIVEVTQGQPNQYPAEELEWLATISFNHAVDLYCSSQEEDCRRWVKQALRLADLNQDGGTLHRTLQAKYQALIRPENRRVPEKM
ncbi:MAG: hypothetical protein Q9163_004005 [Psora crenata]